MCEPLREVLARHQLHDDGVGGAGLLESVQVGDEWVVEGGEGPGLAIEADHMIGVAGERLRQDFEGDLPAEPGIARAVDFAHATGANGAEDFVRAE
jgi:hypothetical protein